MKTDPVIPLRNMRANPASGLSIAARDHACQNIAMPKKPIDRLRAICLILPEAVEKETWGAPTFRVRDKIFAMERHDDGRVSVWCKAPPGSQMVLTGADPDRFFAPPYVGSRGWVGMWLDHRPDWTEVAALVDRSYRLTAPKKLVVLMPERRPTRAGK